MLQMVAYAFSGMCIAGAVYGFIAVGVQGARCAYTRTHYARRVRAVPAGYVPNTPLPTHNAR